MSIPHNGVLAKLPECELQDRLHQFLKTVTALLPEPRLPVQLFVTRQPQEVADEQRRKAQEAARRKGRTLSPRHLALLNWSLYITNAPPELLSLEEAVHLTPRRVRWQIELIFKVWKSEAQLDRVAGRRRESCVNSTPN